jgi:hypothetical protein
MTDAPTASAVGAYCCAGSRSWGDGLSITCHIAGEKTVQLDMPSDSRARLIAYLCQAGLSTPRANAVLDDYAHELAALQRLRMDELDLTGQKARIVGRIVDLIDPKAG